MLALILASHEHGFAGGEIWHLFDFDKSVFDSPLCSCFREDCDVWKSIKKGSESDIYQALSGQNPGVKYITDSSSAEWFQRQINYSPDLRKELIFIYKTPDDWMKSVNKRGRKETLDDYVFRYSKFLALVPRIDNEVMINLHDFTESPRGFLKKMCDQLGLPYDENQLRFWKFEHHAIEGSPSARIHLAQKETPDYDRIKSELIEERSGTPTALKHHREIYKTKEEEERDVDLNSHPAYELYEFFESLKFTGDKESQNSSIEHLINSVKDHNFNDDTGEMKIKTLINLRRYRDTEDEHVIDSVKTFADSYFSDFERWKANRILGRKYLEIGKLEKAKKCFRLGLTNQYQADKWIKDFIYLVGTYGLPTAYFKSDYLSLD